MTDTEKRECLEVILPHLLREFGVAAEVTTDWAAFRGAHGLDQCGIGEIPASYARPPFGLYGCACLKCHLIFIYLPLLDSEAELGRTLRHEVLHLAHPDWDEGRVRRMNGEPVL